MIKDTPVLGGQLTLEVCLIGLGEHIWFWVGSFGSTLFRRIPATPCPDSLSAFLSPPQVEWFLLVFKAIQSIHNGKGYLSQDGNQWFFQYKSHEDSRFHQIFGQADNQSTSWELDLKQEHEYFIAGFIDAHTPAGESWEGDEVSSLWKKLTKQISNFGSLESYFRPLRRLIEKEFSLLDLETHYDLFVEFAHLLYTYTMERCFGPCPITILSSLDLSNQFFDHKIHRLATQSSGQSEVHRQISKQLEQWIARGKRVLLLGPTGVGKTELSKSAAIAIGAQLIQIKGHPGLDDRLLFGSTYPDSQGGFHFVDGPMAEAWRAAVHHPVLLLLDELTRMDSYYHAVLIGAFDGLTGEQVLARPRLVAQLDQPLDPLENYYVLMLPNGNALVAPTRNLSLICTANLGIDYTLASQELDPALLSRFHHVVELSSPPPEQVESMLWELGLPFAVARVMRNFAEFTEAQTADRGGLLRHPLNLRVLTSWAHESLELAKLHQPWGKALLAASYTTVFAFTCPRKPNGCLEQKSIDLLKVKLASLINAENLV